jgi:hypothetical protein
MDANTLIPDTINKESDQPKSWRAVLPVHPAADLFPLMSESELQELAGDIIKHGLRYPVILCRKNKSGKPYLLDGRNRLDAMESVGISPFDRDGKLRHWSEREGDPYDIVLSMNVHRRHLTGEQKRELIAKILKAKPGESNRKIAKQTKADHKTVAAVRGELESGGEIPQLEKTTGADGKQYKSRKKKAPKPSESAEIERDRKACLALYQKVTEAERERAQLRAQFKSAEISPEQRRRENANLGITATARSKQNLEWFTVACREYLPNVTVESHRQEARRLVAELTAVGATP